MEIAYGVPFCAKLGPNYLAKFCYQSTFVDQTTINLVLRKGGGNFNKQAVGKSSIVLICCSFKEIA